MGIQSNYFIKMNTSEKYCNVCGDKALGYNFNAITCESCKAFFRRNALSKKEFVCPFNQKCEINVVTRRFCQRCRLEKCFSIGMRKEYIMSEEDKMLKRRKIELNRAKRRMNGGDMIPSKIRRENPFDARRRSDTWETKENSVDLNYINLSPETFMSNDSPTLLKPSPVSPQMFDLSNRMQSHFHFSPPPFALSNVEYQSAFHPSSPTSSLGNTSPRLDVRTLPTKESSAAEIVTFILQNPDRTTELFDKLMPSPIEAIEVITKILNSQKDAMQLVSYFIGSPMDGLKVISKIMNSPYNALAVFSKFVSSPTDTLEFIAKVVNSPAEVLQFVKQLMTSPEDAMEILNKFMDSPAEALKMLSDMVNSSVCDSSAKSDIDDQSSCASPTPPIPAMMPTLSIGKFSELSPLGVEFGPFGSPFRSLANPRVRNFFDSIQSDMMHSFVDLTSPIAHRLPKSASSPSYDMPKIQSPILSDTLRTSPSLYSLPDHLAPHFRESTSPNQFNTLESVIAEAINMEYNIGNKSNDPKSKDLNESESAKLNELIVANKALYMPVDDDLSSLSSDVDRIHTKVSPLPFNFRLFLLFHLSFHIYSVPMYLLQVLRTRKLISRKFLDRDKLYKCLKIISALNFNRTK